MAAGRWAVTQLVFPPPRGNFLVEALSLMIDVPAASLTRCNGNHHTHMHLHTVFRFRIPDHFLVYSTKHHQSSRAGSVGASTRDHRLLLDQTPPPATRSCVCPRGTGHVTCLARGGRRRWKGDGMGLPCLSVNVWRAVARQVKGWGAELEIRDCG